MNINLTLLIQVIYFFIVYLLIERLLLRPAVAIILKEDQEHLKLQGTVAFNKEQLRQQELEKNKAWRVMQQLFAKAIPRSNTLERVQTKQVMIEPHALDQELVQDIIKKSTDALVAKVGHDTV